MMKYKKLLSRLALAGVVATLMAGCCVFPYGPRGHYGYGGGHDGYSHDGYRGR